MRRMKLVLAMAAVLVGMLAAVPGPAMADDCDFRERGKKDDVVVCRDDGERERFKVDDFDFADHNDFDVDHDDFDNEFLLSPLFISPFFFVEEIDVDCDEIDDDLDGLIDEGAVCEVEVELEEAFD